LVHHETIEAFQKYPPDASMNPYWLYEGNFDDWLSKTYPSLGLTEKVSPPQHTLVSLVLHPETH
jgi:hypothetical protein